MPNAEPLVSIGLPVRNAGTRVAAVVRSVLAQDHERIELVISDNASTDETSEVCRDLARSDRRIVYHRHPENIGLLNNFTHTIALARGEFFRWIGDDDRLEPAFVTQCLGEFAADPRRILVTTQVAYTGPQGVIQSASYDGTVLASGEPVDRFVEMLRLLNESYLLIDPLYGLLRREPVAAIPRRNMLREDEVFATKLALAGPWGHVPRVLAHRYWKHERISTVARRLGVPAWRSHLATTLQCREILSWLRTAELGAEQRRRARAAVYQMYLRRQRRTIAHRSRKFFRVLAGR
ncbi:MAG: glycosyltransferase family 2 protein [Micromonosporaceae bacterium]|nr:glycosyltransferase family 2 protein [Micromonosporaceae bacterium]